jgi:hypothetical protein
MDGRAGYIWTAKRAFGFGACMAFGKALVGLAHHGPATCIAFQAAMTFIVAASIGFLFTFAMHPRQNSN